jgi:hypothetical protein
MAVVGAKQTRRADMENLQEMLGNLKGIYAQVSLSARGDGL